MSLRHLTTRVGHVLTLSVANGYVSIGRSGLAFSSEILLDRIGAQILIAYLNSIAETPPEERQPEHLADRFNTVFEVIMSPAPAVRIHQGGKSFDIAAPGWVQLKCELEILLPRLSPIIDDSVH